MTRLEAKHSLAIRWFHWINFPVLFTMVWSGLLIYWAYHAYGLRIGRLTIVEFFPAPVFEALHIPYRLAEGMAWHFVFMWLFTVNGLLYVGYLAVSGAWRLLVPRKESFREALEVVKHDLGIRREPLPRAKFNASQRLAYTGVVLLGLGSLISGLAIYRPTQLAWLTWLLGGYKAARFIHFWCMMLICAFFLVHLAQVVRAGWNNLRAMLTGYELVTEPAAADTNVVTPEDEGEEQA